MSSAAAAASEIADVYCRTFSSCCVAGGQPPIDAARCRELTAATVAQKLAMGAATFLARSVASCVEGIRARTAACGKEDVSWSEISGTGLFAPSSIQIACDELLGTKGAGATFCGTAASCGESGKCAIDECTTDGRVGELCPGGARCLDGASCSMGKCVPSPSQPVSAACDANTDCALGLVCFRSQCALGKEHPELYEERHSPYRIGADTCRIYTTL